uniref:Serpentine receptor class gamma n=1 Tax=Panagrellus redivivus TaxID=6233 RepID=A0A7E5A2A6_PANRE
MKILHLLDPDFVVFGPYMYMIPTVFLYILLIYLILFSEHRKKFSYAFYKIFALKAGASIICVVTFEICFRLPDAPAAASFMRLLPPTGVFPKSLFVICYHNGTVMFMMEGFMSFNRATTILLSTRHNGFWARAMPWIYVVSAVFPLTFTWSLFFVNVTLFPDDINDDTDDRSFKMEDAPVSQDTATFYILIALALLSLWNIVWNLYTLSYLVRRALRAFRASSNTAKVVCDTRQFIFSFLTFLIELFTIIVTVSSLNDNNKV